MAEKKLVRQVTVKGEDGQLGNPYSIGATFEEIVDTRAGKGNYSLAQFFDNYVDFMNSTSFIAYGDTKPTNTHVRFWIDTSSSNL